MANPLYLTDDRGTKWRIHDVAFGRPPAAPHKRVRLPIGDPRAHYRAFVNAEGVQRIFQFQNGASHATDQETLERQLRGAGYAPTSKFDPMSRSGGANA